MAFTTDEVFQSPDGIEWERHQNESALISARFADDQWIGLTDASLSTQRIMGSSDGMVWTERLMVGPVDTYRKIAHGAGLWLAVGVSRDDEFGLESRVTLTSADGIRWQRHHTPGEVPPSTSLSHGGGMWFLSAGTGNLSTSTDGTHWTARSIGSAIITALETAGGVHVAVGTANDEPEGNVVWGSPDGWTWTPGEITGVWRGGQLQDVAYGGGQWLAVGMEFGPPAYRGVALASNDGLNWAPVLTAEPFTGFSGVAFGEGRWNVVGGGTEPLLFTSLDSVDWTFEPLPTLDEPWEWIRFSNGRWFAGRASQDSPVYVSSNGMDWSPLGDDAQFHDVHFADGQWMAIGSRPDGTNLPTTVRSTDGINWAAQDLDLPLDSQALFQSIAYAAGRWIIAGSGKRDGLPNALLWSSTDGAHWQENRIGTKEYLHAGVKSDGRRVFLAGGFGILASDRLLPAAAPRLDLNLEAGGNPFLSLQGEGGERYDIEFSPDLKPSSWSMLDRVVPGNDGLQMVPLDPHSGGQGFWRVRW